MAETKPKTDDDVSASVKDAIRKLTGDPPKPSPHKSDPAPEDVEKPSDSSLSQDEPT